MDTIINIGIIGTGVGIRTHFKAFKDIQSVKVIGIVGSSFERAKEFATSTGINKAYENYKTLCDDDKIDLICITSPNLHHFDEISYALNKGKHIIAEKPLAMSVSQNEKLIELSENSKKLCIVNHQLRFNPYLLKIKEFISSDRLGRIYYIKIHQQGTGFSNRNLDWVWSFDETQGGGVRLAMASHLVDLINFWFPKTKYYDVSGNMDTVVETRLDKNGESRKITASSFFSASLSLGDMLNVHLSATAAAIGASMFNISVYGTIGELHFDLKNKLSVAFLGDKSLQPIEVDGVFEDEKENKASIFSGSFRYLAPIIAQELLIKDLPLLQNAASFGDALKTQIVLDAIKDSALSGNSINLSKGFKTNSTI